MTNYVVLLLVAFAGFISAADNWIASLLLPSIANSFSVDVSTASIVLTAYLIPYGVMQPVYGFFSDKLGKVRILKCLVLLLAISTFLCAQAHSLSLLTCYRFITGFFAAGIIAVSLGILGETYDRSQLTKVVGLFLGIVFLGQGLSAGIGGWLIEHIGWRQIFLIFSGAAIISFVSLFLLPSIGIEKGQTRFWSSVFNLLRTRNLRNMYLLACCNGFAVLGGYSFIGSYLHVGIGVEYSYVGMGLMLFGFVSFAGGFINKLFLAKFSHNIVLNIGFITSCIALIIFSTGNVIGSYVAILMLGLGYVWVQSILASKALELAENNKGLSSGIIGVGIFCGGGLGTLVGSAFLKYFSFPLLFIVFAVVVVFTLIFLNSKRKSVLQIKTG